MFSQITQVNKDIEAFIKIYETNQTNQTNKIDDIIKLSLELKALSESIKKQKMSQDELDKIAEVVSTHLNLEKHKLSFEKTLKLYVEDIKSHTTKEIKSLQSDLDAKTDDQNKILCKSLKLYKFKKKTLKRKRSS